MANFIDLSNINYCGKEAQEIFSRDIYSMDLRNAGVTFMDGVKGKMKMYSGEIGDAWQLYTCPFTPSGSASLAEAYIEPAAIKVNQENCYDTFWNTFLVEQTEISLRGGIPATFGEWYFGKLRQKMAREYQEIFWQGDTGRTATTKTYLKAVDGVETQLAANSGVTTGATSAFTVDNILAQVEDAINSAMTLAANGEYATDNLKVLMNYSDVQLLKMALGTLCCPNNQSIFSNYAMGPDGGVIIFGIPVISTLQSRNTIIVGDPRNLVLGYDTLDSRVEYRLIDMRQTEGSNMFRILAISNIAVGIIFPEGFVFLH